MPLVLGEHLEDAPQPSGHRQGKISAQAFDHFGMSGDDPRFVPLAPLDRGGIAKRVQLAKQSIAQLRHLGEINVLNIHGGHGFLAAFIGRRARNVALVRAPLA